MFGFGKKAKYAALLKDIDYAESSEHISAMYLALIEDAKSKGCEVCVDKSILKAHTSFVTNPCLDTAIKLLEVDPDSLSLFKKNGETAATKDGWALIVKLSALREGTAEGTG